MIAKILNLDFVQEVIRSQSVQLNQRWLGNMKKYFGISLALLYMYVNAEIFKEFFKKLRHKKYQVILNTTKNPCFSIC